MGPESAKSFPGSALGAEPAGDRPSAPPRRSTTGGAAQATSSAPSARPPARRSPPPTRPHHRQLGRLPGAGRGLASARRAGLRRSRQPHAHRAPDVLLFALAHPRWEFVFQPKYAAYLNLIEPWWKILRSLALKGAASRPGTRSSRRSTATAYWNAHRHPFVWGRRRRHRRAARPASPACRGQHELAGCTT